MTRTKKSTPKIVAMVSADDFLAMVVTVIEMDGWVSGGEAYKAGAGTRSTAQLVWAAMDANCWRGTDSDPTLDDFETAKAAVTWFMNSVANKPSPSDFDMSLAAALVPDLITKDKAGIVASVIKVAEAGMAREAQAAKDGENSDHVGTVGDKITVTVSVLSAGSFFGRFGETTIYKMKDETGNVFTWFSSSMSTLFEGATYEITGTVKKHDEFRGVKQTILTRCKFRAVK